MTSDQHQLRIGRQPYDLNLQYSNRGLQGQLAQQLLEKFEHEWSSRYPEAVVQLRSSQAQHRRITSKEP